MKKIVFAAAAVAIAASAMAVWSQGRPDRPGPGGPMGLSCPVMAVAPPHSVMISQLTQDLRLTKDQGAKLKKIVTDGEKKVRALQQSAAKASQALRMSLLASKYDARKSKELAASAEKAEAAVVSACIDQWTQIRSVLTSKQAASLQNAMADRRPGFAGPPPGGPGMPPPPSAAKKGAR